MSIICRTHLPRKGVDVYDFRLHSCHNQYTPF
ncbi:hypothetical protein Cassandra_0461 [Pseudomonas phage Cassandra]|nr:hypothetical protein Cassandra_0461 [Pseudomonas phage Cassandra]WPK39649.1 hypothetical protein Deiofobo_0452 [Pseudomonas phage Deifobo]WPK40170.1 hypothetical protein ETTORE_0461 [Pseudomonas phage Ettore]WPK40685.1 hypothetical protein Paride_0455 [Pseudomonas phage Paride]